MFLNWIGNSQKTAKLNALANNEETENIVIEGKFFSFDDISDKIDIKFLETSIEYEPSALIEHIFYWRWVLKVDFMRLRNR